MLFRYKILYEILNNKISRFFIIYILKYKYFYKYNLIISYPILIPRFETEIFLTIIFKIFSNIFIKRVFEGGFGSGAISLSLSKISILFYFISIDNSYICYKSFKVNKKNKLNIMYFFCNWFYLFYDIKKFNIILVNPPYLSFNDFLFYRFNILDLNNALFSNKQGFNDLLSIIYFSYDKLYLNGILLLEHGHSQAKNIRFAMRLSGFINVYTINDFSGLNRFTCGEK